MSDLEGSKGNTEKGLGLFSEERTDGSVLFFFEERIIRIRKGLLFEELQHGVCEKENGCIVPW